MTKLIDVAVLLQTHPRLNKAPSECRLVSETFPGEGFFPVMSGRFGTADYVLSVAAKPRLLLVGQDFGTVTYKLGLSPNIGEDWGGFPYLCHWLNEGGLAKDPCFFSNALLTAWVDAEYGRRAELARQLGVTRRRITDWLAGRKTPSLEQGLTILQMLRTAEKGSAKWKNPSKPRIMLCSTAFYSV